MGKQIKLSNNNHIFLETFSYTYSMQDLIYWREKTYVEWSKSGADIEDSTRGSGATEERQEGLRQQLGPVEVGLDHRLGVVYGVLIDIIKRHRCIIHLCSLTRKFHTSRH